MEKVFVYSSREEAFGDLLKSYKAGIDFNSSGMIEFYFTEIIREGREDEYWLLKTIFLLGPHNPYIMGWFSHQLDYGDSWSKSSYKLISKISSLYRQTGLKNKFEFKTQHEAFQELMKSLNVDFDWESIELVDFWFREFIRNSPEDQEWVNLAINTIGHDSVVIKYWFLSQVNLPIFWKKEAYNLIKKFADALAD